MVENSFDMLHAIGYGKRSEKFSHELSVWGLNIGHTATGNSILFKYQLNIILQIKYLHICVEIQLCFSAIHNETPIHFFKNFKAFISFLNFIKNLLGYINEGAIWFRISRIFNSFVQGE